MSVALFRFEHVTVLGDAGRPVLDHVTFEIDGRGITAVAGPSGAGKSTLLRLCNRLTVPDDGRVLFRGADIAGLDPLAHRRRVGMVFQRPTLFAGTVRDNLCVACPDGSEAQFAAALDRAALPSAFLDCDGDRLSGGEAQRVCLARTLVTDPEVLLMDEPTSSLDGAARAELERLAAALADSGVPIVWVSHDLDQVLRLAHTTVVLIDGRVADDVDARRYLQDGSR